ncbi:MAG: hypothetical protein FWC41_08535 [Firmicutes bacterium]|nr:hypothetical protein [Bacillota bacterium]
MKYKVNKKDVEMENIVITSGYCTMQSLLYGKEADTYCCGVYGWNSDQYNIYTPKYGKVVISNGYRPVNGIRNSTIIEKYEKKANKIRYNYEMKYQEQIKRLDKLLQKMIDEIITIDREGETK